MTQLRFSKGMEFWNTKHVLGESVLVGSQTVHGAEVHCRPDHRPLHARDRLLALSTASHSRSNLNRKRFIQGTNKFSEKEHGNVNSRPFRKL